MYGSEILQDAKIERTENEGPAGWINLSFQVSSDSEFVDARRRELKMMTEQRNELVHGFLQRWQPESHEKLEATLTYLDTQRELALPVLKHLKTVAVQIAEARQKLLEMISSEDFQEQSELLWLQASPLVVFFMNVTSRIQRKDGWTCLANAGHLAHKELPDEVKCLKECYGFTTLKKLLEGSKKFDILNESIAENTFRTLYRNKVTS
jgi:hypothetical protein